jgi:hypothetical protein
MGIRTPISVSAAHIATVRHALEGKGYKSGYYVAAETAPSGHLRVDSIADHVPFKEWNAKDALAALDALAARIEQLETRLKEIAHYYEAVYAPGDQAYQAVIVARAALADAKETKA